MTHLDLKRDRDSFEAISAELEAVCRRLHEWLEAATVSLTVRADVSGRVKAVDSYLRKIVRRQLAGDGFSDPLVEMKDKIGVRADVLTIAEQVQLVDRIRSEASAFVVVSETDKLLELGAAQLGYLGVHFVVAPADPPLKPEEWFRAEIQVRTVAQSAWAQISHDMIYKIPELVPVGDQRRVNRLASLVELFDEEVDRTRVELLANQDYSVGRLIGQLESALLVARGRHEPFDSRLSVLMVHELTDGMSGEELSRLEDRVSAFALENAEKLRGIYSEYEGDTRNPMLFQPEAILIFHLLSDAGHLLRSRWEQHLPVDALDRLALVWGDAID